MIEVYQKSDKTIRLERTQQEGSDRSVAVINIKTLEQVHYQKRKITEEQNNFIVGSFQFPLIGVETNLRLCVDLIAKKGYPFVC